MSRDGNITKADLHKAFKEAYKRNSNEVREWLAFVKRELKDNPNKLGCFGDVSEFDLACQVECDFYGECMDYYLVWHTLVGCVIVREEV